MPIFNITNINNFENNDLKEIKLEINNNEIESIEDLFKSLQNFSKLYKFDLSLENNYIVNIPCVMDNYNLSNLRLNLTNNMVKEI